MIVLVWVLALVFSAPLVSSFFSSISFNVANFIRLSDLDWTILRLTLLNDKPKSGKIRVGYLGRGEVGTWISRADVADFMLKQVKDTQYLQQAPAITN